jgi:hypothetical protein
LRRQLAKEIYAKYYERNILSCEHKKNLNIFKVKRWRPREEKPKEEVKKQNPEDLTAQKPTEEIKVEEAAKVGE